MFEAIGQGGMVRYRLGTSEVSSADTTRLISALIPGTDFEPDPSDRDDYDLALRIEIRANAIGLDTSRPEQVSRILLTALSAATGEDEELLLQADIASGQSPRTVGSDPLDPAQSLLSQLFIGPRLASTDTAKRLRDKAAEPQLQVFVRVAVTAGTPARARKLLKGLVAALRTVEAPGARLGFVPADPARLDQHLVRGRVELTVRELVGLLGLPLDSEQLPGLPSPHPKALRPASQLQETRRVIGESTGPGLPRPLGLSLADSMMHTQIIGPTGAGKSTLALSLIEADMQAGRSLVLIDPKTDLAMDVLARVPAHRLDDVVVMDPLLELPPGMNVLAQPGRSAELRADSIVGVIRNLYPTMFGPRTADVLTSAVLALTYVPGATIAWLPRLLTEPGLRARIMPLIDDEYLRGFWTQYDALNEGAQAQYAGPVLSRLRSFLLRQTLRRVLDQPEPRFDLGDIFTKPRILIVPLNTGQLGEAAPLLGSLLVSTLWGLALGRASVPKEQRRPVSIYVDEAPEFVRLGGEISGALERSRSLNVGWTLIHQHMDQWAPDTRAAILTNARSKVAFSLGPSDAKTLAAFAPELQPDDFMALPKHHFYAQLIADGTPAPWVSGKTLAPGRPLRDPAEVIRRSQVNYGARLAPDGPSAGPSTPALPDEPHGDDVGRRPRRDR
jgi:hypothetical protein